jgi:hypothetical protein
MRRPVSVKPFLSFFLSSSKNLKAAKRTATLLGDNLRFSNSSA